MGGSCNSTLGGDTRFDHVGMMVVNICPAKNPGDSFNLPPFTGGKKGHTQYVPKNVTELSNVRHVLYMVWKSPESIGVERGFLEYAPEVC